MREKRMRRWLLIGGAILGFLFVAGVLLLRVAPDSLLRDVYDRAVSAPPEDLTARLEAHHQGTGPCLRWVWLSSEGPEEGVEEMAVALRALGLGSSAVGDLAGQFLAWADEREVEAHARGESEELAAEMTAGRPFAGLVMWLNRDRLTVLLESARGEHEVKGRQAFAALTPAQQAGVRAQWEERPRLFVINNLMQVFKQVRKLEVAERLEALAGAVEDFLRTAQDEGAPLSLAELAQAAGLPAEDLFGVPLAVKEREGMVWVRAENGQESRQVKRPVPADAPPPEPPSAPVRCNDQPSLVVLRRAEVDAVFGNLNELATQARVVPSFAQGQAVGFSLFSIRPGSFYARMGLCNGDTVTAVNGLPLTSPDQALEAYAKIRNARRVRLDILRRDAPQVLELDIR